MYYNVYINNRNKIVNLPALRFCLFLFFLFFYFIITFKKLYVLTVL